MKNAHAPNGFRRHFFMFLRTPMSELIISVSGLRGIIGETLNPVVAGAYVRAFSSCCPPGPFVVTRDSRPSGAVLADAIHSVLNSTGRPTIDAAAAATPTTGILIRHLHAAGGIQISASHNPIEYNGIKLFSADGRVVPKPQGQKVLDAYQTGKAVWVGHDKLGYRTVCKDTISEHLQAVIRTVDTDAIRERKFKVLLDSNHGAGALLGERLLDTLDCQITVLGGAPNGRFEHIPEPTADNLKTVCDKVRQLGVDVAFCQDPDADRLAIIDGNGRYIGEEYTVALCLDHLLRTTGNAKHPHRRTKGPIVINCATSRMSEDIAQKYDVPIFRSAVGEANVVDLMLEKKAMFGGEGNGGPIDPKIGFVRDSFVGIAQILDAMAARKKSVAELADELPSYAMVKRKATVELAKVPAMLDKAAAAFSNLPCDRLDGLRIDHGDAWVLLRGSNTEPIIRVFAEAPTEERANALCDDVENVLNG